MKNLVISLLLLIPVAPAQAGSRFAGKLDLNYDFQAICYRNFYDGMWMVGAQKQVWHVQYLPSNKEVLHTSLFYASHLGGPGNTYGLSVGTNIGQNAMTIISSVESMAALIDSLPNWTKKMTAWTSLDFYTGYVPVPGNDQRHFDYGIGGKVNIPLGNLKDWATGCVKPDPKCWGL